MQRQFIRGWWKVISQKHKLTPANALLWASFVLFIFTIIGIITDTNSNLHIISWVLFGVLCAIYFWYFFIQIPAEMFKEIKDQSKGLLELETTQRSYLINNPTVYVQVFIKKVILYHASIENTNFAEIGLYIINGSIFPLEYDIELKETELTVSNVSLNRISTLPFVYQKGAERLEAGRVQTSTIIRQPLSGEIADYLYIPDKLIYSQWKLHIFLTLKFEGHTKQQEFASDWDGVIDRKYPI